MISSNGKMNQVHKIFRLAMNQLMETKNKVSNDIDMLRICAILFISRVKILTCGVIGFLLAVVYSSFQPSGGSLTVTIGPMDPIVYSQELAEVSNNILYSEKSNTPEVSRLLFSYFIQRLKEKPMFVSSKGNSIAVLTIKGREGVGIVSSGITCKELINIIQMEGMDFSKDIARMLSSSENTFPLPYRIIGKEYAPKKHYLNLILGVFLGIFLSSTFTLLKEPWFKSKDEWHKLIDEYKGTRDDKRKSRKKAEKKQG